MQPVTGAGEFAAGLSALSAAGERERDDPAIDPRCVSFVLHHGNPTDRAIVLLHGFTNCPRQFAEFAQLLYRAGFNVYVPRLPRHGMRDRLTTELAGLTAGELRAFAGESVRLAAPLASRLSVLGLSVGATIATQLAQTCALDRVLAVAPFFSVTRVPTPLEPLLTGALCGLPNFQLWWDPRVKQNIGPDHGYPRFATHALAQCLKLGEAVRRAARDTGAQAASSILVLNAKDPAIDNGAARDVWSLWRKHGSAISEYTFENLDVRHDIIEPETYPEAATLVYPVLLRLLEA